jgi:DnaJ-class molecular chaperone
MGIWDRLGNVIKSYLNDEDATPIGKGGGASPFEDPDLGAAFEELNDFLSGKEKAEGEAAYRNGRAGKERASSSRQPPESLRADFAELELPLGASPEECKNAYKRLLKIHHPDRHAGHEGNMKKATEKSARINAAYDRIEKWRRNPAR